MGLKQFRYTAINLEKRKFKGVYLAENENLLAKHLAEQGLYLISAKEAKTTPNSFFTLSKRVTAGELASFCRQLAIMMTSGVSLVQSLDLLRGQSYSRLLKTALSYVYEDVKSGDLLSAAMGKRPKIFPHFFRSMVYVGEVGGVLDRILTALADYLESEAMTRRKVKNAMLYPSLLICMTVGVLVLVMAVLVPTFMTALNSMEVEIPTIALVLNRLSLWGNAHWIELLAAIFLGIALFFALLRIPCVRYCWHKFLFRAPILTGIYGSLITARFARSFSLLIEGGSGVVEALEVVCAVVDNRYVEAKMKAAIEDVRRGTSVAAALGKRKIFPPLILQMIAVGEETDSLAQTLMRACPFFDGVAEEKINHFATVLQPLILGFIALFVGVLFYAIYSPLLEIMDHFGG